VATEVRRGTFAKLFVQLDEETKIRAKAALAELALVVEKQAKINASSGAHKYGTKTPAKPGTGPAVISGTLRRAITHTPVKFVGGEFSCYVGMGTGFYPSYGGMKSKTPANKYAMYLEKTGLRNGVRYPFLIPAFKFAMGVPARLIYQEAFGSRWRVIM
jgi:hypothetical protein